MTADKVIARYQAEWDNATPTSPERPAGPGDVVMWANPSAWTIEKLGAGAATLYGPLIRILEDPDG